jgi:hypothetical protein
LATGVAAALTTNLTTFAPTTAEQTALTAQILTLTTANNKLTGYIANAKGDHSVITLRNTETVTVYGMLNTTFRTLVDGTAGGVKATIELAGFDASADAVAHGIPDTPVISKISDTNRAEGTAKVLLVKHKKKTLTGAKAAKSTKGLKYSMQVTPAPVTTASVWTNEIQSESSRDLLLTGLVKGSEVAARVRAEDGKLKSPWSEPMTFLPRKSAPNLPTTTPTPAPTTGTTTTPPATG